MQAYHWSMLGMTIDICGAFFLSVEAIKLQNIEKLRDVILPKISAAIASPRVAIGDISSEERREIAEYNKTAGFGNRILLYVLSHFLGGLVLVFLAYYGLRLFKVDPLRSPGN